MRATLHQNRNRYTGRFVSGFTLIAEGGYWVGPGLGHFRVASDARQWAERSGYALNN